jgi:hypothetical protein
MLLVIFHIVNYDDDLSSNMCRRVLGQKRTEMARDWKKLHNDEFHNLYSLLNFTIT